MKHFIKFLPILLILGCSNNIYAQKKQGQALIDSLLLELPKAKEDTNKIILLHNLSFAYIRINPDEGIKYGQQELELDIKLNQKKDIANAYLVLGANYLKKSDYLKVLDYDFKSLKIYEELGDRKGIAAITGNIGMAYNSMDDYEKGLEYQLKSLKIYEELGNKRGIANVAGNIGTVYDNMGDYKKALEYQFRSLKINEELGNKGSIAIVTMGIGVSYDNLKDYTKSLEYYQKALKIDEELGDKLAIANVTENIGSSYKEQQNYTASIQYLQKALNIAKDINALGIMKKCYMHLSDEYKLSGHYDTALVNYQEYIKLKDSIFNKDNEKKIGRLEAKADFDRKEDSLKLETQKRELEMQKEMQVKALKYEYEKKQAAAKSEKERQQLVYEEELKRNKLNFDYEEKHLALVAEQKNKALIEKAAQQKRDDIAAQKLQKQRAYTIMGISGIILLLGFSFFIVKERRKSEQEREKSDNLLLNILPAEVASELKSTGGSKAHHFDDVTVLFTDFVNFTKAGENMSPQALVDELDTCFKTFDGIISKYNLEKIKTIGDAYLAVCGLPKADPKHAENIVNAAKEIRAFMKERHAQFGDKTFQIRLGIHSGSVVAGIVGIKKFAYDIWGDTVNTAARMEQNSEAGKINISHTTYELVKDKFTCEYRGEIEAKNKGALKMYFVA